MTNDKKIKRAIAQAVHELRLKNNLDLGDFYNPDFGFITAQTMIMIESGEVIPRIKTLYQIAKGLGIDMGEIFKYLNKETHHDEK